MNIYSMGRLRAVITIGSAMLFAAVSISVFAEENSPIVERSLADLQREVDELLVKGDSVQTRHGIDIVFQLAERMQKEKGDREARRYFEAGLAVNSWALEQQLTLGEILNRAGQPKALKEKAGMVLLRGEDDAVIARALNLLKQKPPKSPPLLETIKPKGPTLALVPVGEIHPVILEEFRAALQRSLGITVATAHCEVELPAVRRTMRERWVAMNRPRIIATAEEKPAFATLLGSLGFTLKQIESDDAAIVEVVRKITGDEQGLAAVKDFDTMIAKMTSASQWDAASLLMSVKAASQKVARPGVQILAVTPLDLCGDDSNFLFGVAETGQPFGLLSIHRFRASFNEEPPDRARLVKRVVKQALSTFGFMLGAPRCTTPECARAYPHSLLEHDQKPSAPCPQCRAAMESALKRKLPAHQ